MEKKSILIFGAGINQLELINAANDLGITSIVIDPSADPPGRVLADFYYQVHGNDYEMTKQIALKHKVGGIVTGQMENPMRLMAKLAQEMDYIFHTPEIVERSLNKVRMKEAFIKRSVRCARGRAFSNQEELTAEKLADFDYPLIAKPSDAFSSRGVVKVNSFSDIREAEEETRSYSSDSTLIVEEYLEGREFSVECITYKGITTVVQVTEKFITPYPYTVEMAHLQPARISDWEREEIEALLREAILAIGIDNSASHAEVMLTEKGPLMIEIGARLGGDFISSHLTKASTGVSMDKSAIQIALGLKPDLSKKCNQYAMLKYIELGIGQQVGKVSPFVDLQDLEGFVFAYCFVKEGDIIPAIKHSAQRSVCLLMKAPSEDLLFEKSKNGEQLMRQKIELL